MQNFFYLMLNLALFLQSGPSDKSWCSSWWGHAWSCISQIPLVDIFIKFHIISRCIPIYPLKMPHSEYQIVTGLIPCLWWQYQVNPWELPCSKCTTGNLMYHWVYVNAGSRPHTDPGIHPFWLLQTLHKKDILLATTSHYRGEGS